MAVLTIKILNGAGEVLKERTDADYTDLTYGAEYAPGDRIVFEASEPGLPLKLQADDALGMAMVLMQGSRLEFPVPFDAAKRAYSPKTFSGNRHYLAARTVPEEEWNSYRNLALNPLDQRGDAQCYPHASANCETRGESVFFARNTIDNVTANRAHGRWPFESWGINMQDDACLKLEFGREIAADKIVLHTRADFPHDNWWKQLRLRFSDGSSMQVTLEKSQRPHVIDMQHKTFSWLCMDQLIKGESESPFPALTQIEVFGRNK